MPTNEYALHDGDRWFLYLPQAPHEFATEAVLADGLQGEPAQLDHWWGFDHKPERVEIRRENDPEPIVLTGPWLEISGAPPQLLPPGTRWFVNLPFALRERAEYAHVFPGHLVGFRGYIYDTIHKAYGDARVYIYENTLRVRTASSDGLVIMSRDWTFPDHIEGSNLAVALEHLEDYVDGLLAEVADFLDARCAQCGERWY